ncbi:hypothetical protein ES708_26751 [subsurface metagenome]
MPRKPPLFPHIPKSQIQKANPPEEIEIERYHGIIVKIGGIPTKTLMLPDWDLSYVEYPPGQMKEYRDAMMKARLSIRQVTDRRIYFVQE